MSGVSVEWTIQARAIGTNTVIIKVVGLSGSSVDNLQESALIEGSNGGR